MHVVNRNQNWRCKLSEFIEKNYYRMTKSILTAVLALAFTSAMADEAVNGVKPEVGTAYYVYNVGQQQYLGGSEGELVLEGAKLTVTLVQSDAKSLGFTTLNATTGNLGAFQWYVPSADGLGQYQDWSVEPVVGKTAVYTLANRQRETNANQYLYHSAGYGDLRTLAQKPGKDFEDGLWMFVSTEASGIDGLNADGTNTRRHANNVYNISGQCVRQNSNSTEGLSQGVYIVGGKKVVK